MAKPRAESSATPEPPTKHEGQTSSSKKRKQKLSELEVDLEAPEPPSKRARRLLKKGKPLPAKVDSDDDKPKPKTKQEGQDKAEKAPRSEHGVWIGNLRFNATKEELRKWLIDNSGGAITEESITRVNMPMTKQAGRDKKEQLANKGFAYVDFNDVGPKVAAIALSETELGFRKLLIKDATSFEGRPKKENADATAKKQDGKSEQPASRKIFVGNLGFKTTEDDLRSHFEKCGEIDWVKIATFEDTGKCKGFGWIKFREPEAAAQAVKGFVKVKEQVETEADFVNPSKNEGEEEEKEEEGSDQDSDAEKPTKRFRTRKWWLNRLMGRPLKLELAEDDQVRYKKRFGKDAPKKAQGDGLKAQRKPGEDAEGKENAGARERSDPAPLKAQDDLMVARLTGAAAKHTGTKITFD